MKSSIRRAMRAARERDYIAWEPDGPEPWAMPAPDLSLQTEQQQRDAKSDKENFREVCDDRLAATRLAITRAAAEIGRQMQSAEGAD